MCRSISPFCEQAGGGESPSFLPGEELVLFREGQALILIRPSAAISLVVVK